jgi:D-alanyl-lipoteichoic acid acyltransferase DltB (MBOAT superfamily)
MLFNSVEFFILLMLTVAAYWCVPSLRLRQDILIVSSLIFYAYWFPPYLALLLGLSAAGYLCGLLAVARPRAAVAAACVLFLGILGYFKYAPQVSRGIVDLGLLPAKASLADVALPLGISFIVFQKIAYVVDIARKERAPEPNPRIFLLFVSFFPQLIAGPICRGSELLPQLRSERVFRPAQAAGGLVLLAAGLFLKSLADSLSGYVEGVYSAAQPVRGASAAATLCFGVQILCDFWGYSTMAVGAALMFGIDIPINFELPYLATSMQEFWRRWHVTLSRWLRDYLYIPLGGSRGGTWLTYRNLILTMLLGGIWHGAGLVFVIWGAIHGAALAAERAVKSAVTGKGRRYRFVTTALGWSWTMAVVFVGWIFFRSADVAGACRMLRRVFSEAPTPAALPWDARAVLLLFAATMVPLHLLISEMKGERIALEWRMVSAAYLLLAGILLGAPTSTPFIYFQF